MTARMAAVIGKPLALQSISDAEARQQQLAWATPEPLVETRLSIFRSEF
jgi:hypothetical protein